MISHTLSTNTYRTLKKEWPLHIACINSNGKQTTKFFNHRSISRSHRSPNPCHQCFIGYTNIVPLLPPSLQGLEHLVSGLGGLRLLWRVVNIIIVHRLPLPLSASTETR